MSDIFQEVEEDLRRDRAARLWRRHGHWLLGGAAAIVLAVGGHTLWRSYDRQQREEAGLLYLDALQAAGADPAKAGEVLGRIATGEDGYAQLAKLDLAAAAAKAGDKARAAALFAAAAEDPALTPALRGLAALLSAYAELDLGRFDAAAARVAPHRAEGDPYRLLALEIAALAAFGKGDREGAGALYAELARLAEAPEAPANLKERVAIMQDRLAS